MVILENNFLEVKIYDRGAEIESIKDISSGIDYVWNANPEYWSRHAPLLFPIVGKVSGDKYMVDGKEYCLNQHGFARDLEFSMEEKTKSGVRMSLNWNEDTLKSYPFKFLIEVTYMLIEDTLSIKYEVVNQDEKVIYFSIGAHPGFNWPLLQNESKEDYYLEFEMEETCGIYKLTKNSLLSREKIPFLKNSKIINLSDELFAGGALVFENLKSERITLKSDKNPHFVTVEFPGFPFLGIWSKENGAPFVCIEPWFGHADFDGFNGEFSEKDDNISLGINEKFECEHKIIIN